jgi:uncharacterized repeat protein (TIGR03803 family)
MSTSARRPGFFVLPLIAIMLLASAAQAQSYNVIHFFAATGDGDLPSDTPTLDAAGNVYGTTQDGYFQCGNVFKYSPQNDGSWVETVLTTFDCSGADGAIPYGNVIFDKTGNLYGTTETAGSGGGGTVFKLSPNPDGTWTRTIIHSFALGNTDGQFSLGGVVFDASGNLYGTTCGGGTAGYGTVFQLKPQSDGSWTESVLYSFQGGTDGSCPYAGVTFDGASNNLYGTASDSGLNCPPACGTVFELQRNQGWKFKVIYSFTGGTDGSQPFAGVVWAHPDTLYGTTEFGGMVAGGAVFQLVLANGIWTESVIHSFNGAPDGVAPQSCLTLDGHNLYGTTSFGGTSQTSDINGTVFKLEFSDGKWTERVLHSFKGPPHDGGTPLSGVALRRDGSRLHIFGLTWRGGPEQCVLGCGSFYEITQ